MNKNISEKQHNIEIHCNLESWKKKPVLQKVYLTFYNQIKNHINHHVEGKLVEIGSGAGNLKTVVKDVICTDLFPNPWIDQVENAYQLSFNNEEISNIILFDVFHHLEYPGNAFDEFLRVLKKEGRLIIFEPDLSVLGMLVYGAFHHEPVKAFSEIKWKTNDKTNLLFSGYYSAQGNAHRMFLRRKYKKYFKDWNIISIKRIAAISYIFSGGYSKPQLIPDSLFKFLFKTDRILSHLPFLFSTRLLVVLEKT